MSKLICCSSVSVSMESYSGFLAPRNRWQRFLTIFRPTLHMPKTMQLRFSFWGSHFLYRVDHLLLTCKSTGSTTCPRYSMPFYMKKDVFNQSFMQACCWKISSWVMNSRCSSTVFQNVIISFRYSMQKFHLHFDGMI